MREDHHSIHIDGREIPLIVRRHPRARRIILRINTAGEGAVVTIPAHADPADGLEMARRQSTWLGERLDDMGARTEFRDGVQVPFQGQDYTLRHDPAARGPVWIEGDEIYVAGDARHMTRRLSDWMKKQARAEIAPLAHAKAANIGHAPSRITIRDTRTRWGSCSSKGGLSFSWRLVMAPNEVLDYVVAHEVAHLEHMNHSPAFWQTVDKLTADARHGRDWLSDNGSALHRIG
ncbi:MAG: M48 family metallopeptidase [Rhodospirillaceae bacterium]|nr:M48 family metallopeptidase [Rhodospirillaceae bacterium]MBL6930785.1 M48 family metallopeptidase [Rhodospirillales bacterium]